MKPEEIFLRGVWYLIPDEENVSWVENVAKQPSDNAPLGDYSAIVREMLEKGISAETIARFAKIVGYETAFGICGHLEESSASYEQVPAIDDEELYWNLFLMDEETETPVTRMHGMNEMILSMDPTGRGMEPKP